MFSFKQEKPLPKPVFEVVETPSPTSYPGEGIFLGENCYWNPSDLPNGHIVAIGASGSGKTQTLKAIAHELHSNYPELQVILLDFHGDQEIVGETCYPLHMASPHGINPLVVNLDPEGGGPNLQAIQVGAMLKKALRMGPNQEGLLLEILEFCYNLRGITQERANTWTKQPPNFADLQKVIESRIENNCSESVKLKLKLAASFQYGVFSRPQPQMQEKLVRIDLSKLPPQIGAIAAESLAWQLMNQHRLLGEVEARQFRTYLFIDEAKEMPKTEGSACDRIIADGRKYGLALALASQSERHLSKDVIGNSATKIVLPVDQTEVKKVASKFRFSEKKVAELTPLTALCRFGKQAELIDILPYYERFR
jgi:type IV secretory pathway VirB4 component